MATKNNLTRKIVFMSVLFGGASTECSPGDKTTTEGDVCYVFHEQKLTWIDAQVACRKARGEIVTKTDRDGILRLGLTFLKPVLFETRCSWMGTTGDGTDVNSNLFGKDLLRSFFSSSFKCGAMCMQLGSFLMPAVSLSMMQCNNKQPFICQHDTSSSATDLKTTTHPFSRSETFVLPASSTSGAVRSHGKPIQRSESKVMRFTGDAICTTSKPIFQMTVPIRTMCMRLCMRSQSCQAARYYVKSKECRGFGRLENTGRNNEIKNTENCGLWEKVNHR